MSYDYFLFARPADGSAPRLDALDETSPPIGSPADVIAGIDAVFPALRWEPSRNGGPVWFGAGARGQPEFLVSAEANGLVIAFKAARLERVELDALATAMRLTVFNPQSGECYAP
ncbi:MAG TPA: hypothetical protein VGH80_06165 [Xanthomonadaceae bacterium]|jgi:hypothetical protein